VRAKVIFQFLRTYEPPSDGQKYCYKTAKMIESGAQSEEDLKLPGSNNKKHKSVTYV